MEIIAVITLIMLVAIVIDVVRFYRRQNPVVIPTRKQALSDWKRLNREWMDEWEEEWRLQTGETRPYGLALPKSNKTQTYEDYLIDLYSDLHRKQLNLFMPLSTAQRSAPIPSPRQAPPLQPNRLQYGQRAMGGRVGGMPHSLGSSMMDPYASLQAWQVSPSAYQKYQSSPIPSVWERYFRPASSPAGWQYPPDLEPQDPPTIRQFSPGH